MVFAREERLALQHLRKDASSTPNINFYVVFLPCEHDFWRSVVPRRDIARHLRVLDTCKTEVADFEVAIFVDEYIAWLEVAMDDTGRVHILQPALLSVRPFAPALLMFAIQVSGKGNIG